MHIQNTACTWQVLECVCTCAVQPMLYLHGFCSTTCKKATDVHRTCVDSIEQPSTITSVYACALSPLIVVSPSSSSSILGASAAHSDL
eukprot:635-Heterococcus_DN1.PRE.3